MWLVNALTWSGWAIVFSLARIERLSGIPSDDAAARAATKELGFTTLHLNRDFEVSYSEVFNWLYMVIKNNMYILYISQLVKL